MKGGTVSRNPEFIQGIGAWSPGGQQVTGQQEGVGARTLLGAPGIATRSKDATRGFRKSCFPAFLLLLSDTQQSTLIHSPLA